DEEHQHESEREGPAVKPERVRGDGDEEAEELDEDESPLECGSADQHGETAGALERAAQAALRVNRLVGPVLLHHVARVAGGTKRSVWTSKRGGGAATRCVRLHCSLTYRARSSQAFRTLRSPAFRLP